MAKAEATPETPPQPARSDIADDIADLVADDEPADETPVEDETPAEEEPAEEAAGEEKPCDEPGCDDPLSKRQLIELLEQEHQVDLSKYTNDREALRGLINAAKLVGVRDVDAQVGRALRGRLGDDEISKIIRGETPAKQEEPAKGKKDGVDFDESWLYKVQVDPKSGDLVPLPGESKDLPDKIKRYFSHREKVLNEFVRDPENFVDGLLQGRLQQIEQLVTNKTQEVSAAQQQEASVRQWVGQNAKVLWVNGDPNQGTTALGDEFFAKATDLAEAGVSDPIKQLTLALAMVKGPAARVPPVKAPNPRAQHAGSGSRAPQKAKSIEDLLDTMDLDEAYAYAIKHGIEF